MTSASGISLTSIITPISESEGVSCDSSQTISEFYDCITERTGDLYRISYTCTEKDAQYTTQIVFSVHEKNKLRVRRSGDISSDMLFEVGHTHFFLYRISPYSFDASVTASEVSVSDGPGEYDIDICVKYLLTVGNESSVCEMHIRTEGKDG